MHEGKGLGVEISMLAGRSNNHSKSGRRYIGGTGKSWNRDEESVGIDCFVGEADRNAGRYSATAR